MIEIDSLPQQYNGIYTVMDAGPSVQGRQVDVYMWGSCNEALSFGRKPIHLTVLRLGWNPRATTPKFPRSLLQARRNAAAPVASAAARSAAGHAEALERQTTINAETAKTAENSPRSRLSTVVSGVTWTGAFTRSGYV